MSFWKNLAAAAAGVAVYKLVDYGLRRLERDVMHHEDVPLQDPLPNAEKDAIVMAGSRIDHIPTVEERDRIAHAINLTLSIIGTATVLAVQERLFDGVNDDDSGGDPLLLKNLLIASAVFVGVDLILKPALGFGEPTGRKRRYLAKVASKAAQAGTIRALTPG